MQEPEKKPKTKQAIALTYEPEEDAPKVVAAGKGHLAERIIERAKEADVPIHRNEKLAETLSRLDIGEMIPPELYEVVAEILIFVDAMDRIQEKAVKAARKKSL
jgi:flagellar biosynthesis protein